MKRAVICFTRVPKPGQTKTRLLPLLSGEHCAQLHRAFLKDLSILYRGFDADLFVAYTPDPHWQELQELFPTATSFFPQEGEDLGARMKNAIASVLDLAYDSCILTGSDLPLLTAAHLESGFAALEQADVTFGPTSDGGYYLVGMKRLCPEVFEKQSYGGSSVWENTLAAAQNAGYSVAAAEACDDVDTPEDLRQLWQQIAGNGSHTACFLEEIQKEGVTL